jgi:hypothetical protein
MSTAAFVMGADGAERLTRMRPALGAVVLGEESSAPLAFNLAPEVYSPPHNAD